MSLTPSTEKKLFLLDAMALIYRAYHAMRDFPRRTSAGKNTSAQYGFTNTLMELLRVNNPTHIAVVFDTHAPTQRHVAYEAYKANREKAPEDLLDAIPDIYALLDAFCIPTLALDGYEADDIIGTLSVRASAENFDTYMVTPDKDYGQLVSERVWIYKPAQFKNPARILGVEDVKAQWDIRTPRELIDILALMGDAVDNIPGVKGVGQKSAAKLIAEYGSVENLLAHKNEIVGSLGKKIQAGEQDARMSKDLATIQLDVPIEVNLSDLKRREIDEEKLKHIFSQLEFRTLAQRIFGTPNTSKKNENTPSLFDEIQEKNEDAPPVQNKFSTLDNTTHNYHLIEDLAGVKTLVENVLTQAEKICVDTETTGLDIFSADLIGISFCTKAHEAYYINMPTEPSAQQEVLSVLRTFFQHFSGLWIGQNLKYDMSILRRYGIIFSQGDLFDTMIAQYLLDSETPRNMDALAEKYLSYSPISITQLIGKNKNAQAMREVDITLLTNYAAEDADITFQLYKKLLPLLHERELYHLFSQVEMPLVRVLCDMEQRGVEIDNNFLHTYSAQLQQALHERERAIRVLVNKDFNLASPKQLGAVLFEDLGLDDKAKKTRTGQYATDEGTLTKLVDKHPVIAEILAYREVAKLKSTYADTLPQLARKGRVHTTFNQATTLTGRLSSERPNLQNIPVRTPLGRELRKAFIARKGARLLAADYSQIELRVIAALSGDANMVAAFKDGLDIHTATAMRIYKVEKDALTKDMRYKAKSVNFGIIYGQGAFGLAKNLKIAQAEARDLIAQYFHEYAQLQTYMTTCVEEAKRRGYAKTLLGRIRWLRNINSENRVARAFDERNAINMPVQGTAADMIKKAMVAIEREFAREKLRSQLLLQVHDELLFEYEIEEEKIVREIVEREMAGALILPNGVPVVVDMGVGENWLEAHG